MKAAEHRESDHLTLGRRLDIAGKRGVVVQGLVATRLAVITDIFTKDAPQVTFAEDDHVIKAFAPDRTDDPLDIWGLPRRVRRYLHFPHLNSLDLAAERLPVDPVVVPQQVRGCAGVGEGLHDLNARPIRPSGLASR